MASTEELEAQILAEMEENPEAYLVEPVNDILMIDSETRTINVPASETLFGTYGECDVERKYFKCPKIVGDNIDLSKHRIYISYMPVKEKNITSIPDTTPDMYYCEDMAVDGDYITFSWKLSGNVLETPGFIGFAVVAKYTEGDSVKTRWKTIPAVGTVLLTLPDGEAIEERYPDIIGQLLNRMDEVEVIATPEAMQEYVDAYLEEHPAELDENLSDNTKAAPAGMVGELKSDISQLSEEIDDLKENVTGGSGLTDDLKSALKTYFTNVQTLLLQLAFVTEENVGATLITNAQAVVTALDASGTESDNDNTGDSGDSGSDVEAVVYNVFDGEYVNTGYSGTNQELFGSNTNVYQTKIDITDADRFYWRVAKKSKINNTVMNVSSLAIYDSNDNYLGHIDLSDTSLVTAEDMLYETNGLETIDDTVIYTKAVGSVSLEDYPERAYGLVVSKGTYMYLEWEHTAQSTGLLTLEGV